MSNRERKDVEKEWSYRKSVPAIIIFTGMSVGIIGPYINLGWFGYIIGAIAGFGLGNVYVLVKHKLLKL